MSELIALVMAAGHGTRMKSSLPKVLHPACGRPLVYYPVRAALELGASRVVVVANPQTRDPIEEALSLHCDKSNLDFALQEVPQGTGDAARAGISRQQCADDAIILILSGDVPLLSSSDLRPLLDALEAGAALSFMTFIAADPTGYGRVLRDSNGLAQEIREHKDLETDEQRAITESNAGVYAARAGALRDALGKLSPNNAQGEYYLTDIVALISQKSKVVSVVADQESLAGVNDQAQLRDVELILFERIRRNWGRAGVRVVGHPLIDDSVTLGAGCTIEDGVCLRGQTKIGEGSLVDVGTVIVDTTVGANVTIKPHCMLTQSEVGSGVQLGPFAHLRPQSTLEDDVHMGNFVETKNTILKKGAKANHLAYIGDAEIGEKSNLGAGTIVCNYDGFLKERTVVGKGVFIGSDSQLVAPLTIGDGAYVATATTVTKDVPAGGLAIGRVKQSNKDGYAEPLRARLKANAARVKAARESKA